MAGNRQEKTIRAALYARVSTLNHGQDPEVQLQPLRRIAAEKGWQVVGEFVDIGQSGSKESRPELDRMMDMIRRGKVDILAVHRFDRLGRSVRHLLSVLDELRHLNVDFYSATEAISTDSSVGRMVFTFLAGVAEFEKNLIMERVISGLDKAKVDGTQLGRPLRHVDLRPARLLLGQGHSMREVAKMLGIPRSTLKKKLVEDDAQQAGHKTPSGEPV